MYYSVDGMVPSNKWEVVKNLEVYFAPLAVNINQEFHDFMKEFFFDNDSIDANKSSLDDKKARESLKAKVSFPQNRCSKIRNCSTK